jgi:hypothetical protein
MRRLVAWIEGAPWALRMYIAMCWWTAQFGGWREAPSDAASFKLGLTAPGASDDKPPNFLDADPD